MMRHRISRLTMQPRCLMTAICMAVLLFFFLGTDRAYAQEISRIATDQIKGDVNGDGYVNMNDVTFVINIILGKNETEYELATADVNGDGFINMNDVTAIINIILGNTSGEEEEDDDTPPVGDDDANPGLPVLMPKK